MSEQDPLAPLVRIASYKSCKHTQSTNKPMQWLTAAWQGWPPSWHIGRHTNYTQASSSPDCRGRASLDIDSQVCFAVDGPPQTLEASGCKGTDCVAFRTAPSLGNSAKLRLRVHTADILFFPLFDMLRLGVHKADMHTNHFSMFRAGGVMTRSSEHQQS